MDGMGAWKIESVVVQQEARAGRKRDHSKVGLMEQVHDYMVSEAFRKLDEKAHPPLHWYDL